MEWSRKLLVSIIVGSSPFLIFADARGDGRFLNAFASDRYSFSQGAAIDESESFHVSQLAQCIIRARKLDEDSIRLENERAKLGVLLSSISSSGEKISAFSNVVVTSRRSVEIFNALLDHHNQLVRRSRIEQQTLNRATQSHNVDIIGHKAECGKK